LNGPVKLLLLDQVALKTILLTASTQTMFQSSQRKHVLHNESMFFHHESMFFHHESMFFHHESMLQQEEA